MNLEQYTANVATDTKTLLRDLDAEVGAIAGGPADQTVSADTAIADRKRKWWAICLCSVLSVCVQRDHCGAMFSGAPSPWYVYPRAAYCFLSVPWVLWWAWHFNPAMLCAWAALMAANIAWGLVL